MSTIPPWAMYGKYPLYDATREYLCEQLKAVERPPDCPIPPDLVVDFVMDTITGLAVLDKQFHAELLEQMSARRDARAGEGTDRDWRLKLVHMRSIVREREHWIREDANWEASNHPEP